MSEEVTMVLAIVGTLFIALATLGILRLPDVYTRMSATSKGASLGAICLIAAVGVSQTGLPNLARVLVAILLIFLTIPVGAHVLGRAAYRAGVPLAPTTVQDDLKGRYDSIFEDPGDPPGPPGGA